MVYKNTGSKRIWLTVHILKDYCMERCSRYASSLHIPDTWYLSGETIT